MTFETIDSADLATISGGAPKTTSSGPQKEPEELRARRQLDRTNPNRVDQSSLSCTASNAVGAGLGRLFVGAQVGGGVNRCESG